MARRTISLPEAVDETVKAAAERGTFDFAHFRATTDRAGHPWRLVIEEDVLAREIDRQAT